MPWKFIPISVYFVLFFFVCVCAIIRQCLFSIFHYEGKSLASNGHLLKIMNHVLVNFSDWEYKNTHVQVLVLWMASNKKKKKNHWWALSHSASNVRAICQWEWAKMEKRNKKQIQIKECFMLILFMKRNANTWSDEIHRMFRAIRSFEWKWKWKWKRKRRQEKNDTEIKRNKRKHKRNDFIKLLLRIKVLRPFLIKHQIGQILTHYEIMDCLSWTPKCDEKMMSYFALRHVEAGW